MTRRQALHLGSALCGALLLSLPASRFRLELGCADWPPAATSVLLAASYLAALALLAVGWLGWWRSSPRLAVVLAGGAAVHALALVAPPFLSMDPLFYAAVGRAMARYGASPWARLGDVMPHDDPFFLRLGADWQWGTSAYFPGWNQLSRGVALAGGDSVAASLRLYQALGLLAMLGAAALVARAVEAHESGRAAAAVLLCPLAVVEATQAAHNDHLLALAVALWALATVRARPLAGFAALAGGLAVKASALLLLGFDAVALVAARVRTTAARLTVAAGVAATAIAGLLVFGPRLSAALGRFTLLFQHHCARSLECLLRDPLYRHRHVATAAAIGIAFRLAGAAWLIWAGVRAGRDRRPLAWAALALLGYYTLFHAYWQAWYLLPLVPLLPFSDEKWRPMLIAACLAAPAHCAVMLPFNCVRDTRLLRLEELLETSVVVLPVAIAWITCRRSRSPNSSYR